jgi:hypothetical protein
MDLSGPGIDVKLKERKKERKKVYGLLGNLNHIGKEGRFNQIWQQVKYESIF